MDILDEIEENRRAGENADISRAQANADWANTFANIPSADRLRATRDLTDQVNTALERRLALDAQSNLNAQKILYNSEKLRRQQAMEPLQKTDLEWKIAADEARAKKLIAQNIFTSRNQVQTEEDETGFLEHMNQSNAAQGTKAFADAALTGLRTFRHLSKETRETYLKQARIKIDPDAVMAQMEERMVPGSTVNWRLDAESNWLPTISPPPVVKPADLGTETVTSLRDAAGNPVGKDGNPVERVTRTTPIQPGAATPAPTAAVTLAVPAVGELRGGYKFKGGNPADKANWEK